jgi:hypothetical protein
VQEEEREGTEISDDEIAASLIVQENGEEPIDKVLLMEQLKSGWRL